MPDHAFLFHLQDIVVNAVFPVSLPVRYFVLAVDKAVIHIVGMKGPELRIHRSFYGLQIQGPAVGASGIVRSEMDLEKDILSKIPEGFPVDGKSAAVARCQIKIVDPAPDGPPEGLYSLLFSCLEHVGGTDADLADPVSRFLMDSVFHVLFSLPLQALSEPVQFVSLFLGHVHLVVCRKDPCVLNAPVDVNGVGPVDDSLQLG